MYGELGIIILSLHYHNKILNFVARNTSKTLLYNIMIIRYEHIIIIIIVIFINKRLR